LLQHTKVVAFTATHQDNDGFATTKLLILQQQSDNDGFATTKLPILQQQRKLWHFTASHRKGFILERHLKADLADEKL